MDIRSALGEPLRRIHARGGRFLVAATARRLLVGDLGVPGEAVEPAPRRMAEVPWPAAGGRRVRFILDHPQVCACAFKPCLKLMRSLPSTRNTTWGVAAAVPLHGLQSNRWGRWRALPSFSCCCHPQVCLAHADGELAVLKYSSAHVTATLRTAHFRAALLSLRLPDGAAEGGAGACQRLAYLGDAETVRVRDLATGADVAAIEHGSRIDWLVCCRAPNIRFKEEQRPLCRSVRARMVL